MDLGMDDTFFLVFFQRWRNEYRIIDEYANSGEGLEHYVGIIMEKEYTIGQVICPHDINVVELGYKKSRKARLRELGVDRMKILERGSFEAGVEQVRKLMPNLYVDEKCTQIQAMFINYSKEWDEKHSVWKSAVAIHNRFSHPADAVRYMAMSEVAVPKLVNTRESGRRSGGDGFAL